jgi:hypothetical protein
MNTLEEKMRDAIIDNQFLNYEGEGSALIEGMDNAASACADIARQEAIDFAEWIGSEGHDWYGDYGWKRPLVIEECKPTSELYELFKQITSGK